MLSMILAVLSTAQLFSALNLNVAPVWWALSEGMPPNDIRAFYQTHYKTDAEAYTRARNIEHASFLVSSGMDAGAEWSFNDTVGPRTSEAGFLPAPTLAFGEVVEGLGGGVCQVSSTMYAVALQAGLRVVERHAHARASSYIDKGLDATVNLPPECLEKNDPRYCYDLKLQNPYDFPLSWHAFANDGTLTVWLTGVGPMATVTTRWKSGDAAPFKRRWVRKYFPGHKPKRKQSGANGLDGVLFVDLVWPNGVTEHVTIPSNYKPIDEVWYVGTDWDKNNNPWE
jgi:vancomycin resistance protein YoaR